MVYLKLTKAQKMLLGIAIGDAFGKDYEGKSRSEIQKKFNFKEYRKDRPIYTDDAQTTLAVAELMLSKYPFNDNTLASNIVYAYRRDKRAGYSSRTQGILEKSYYSEDFLQASHNSDVNKVNSNGSVIRALPIGLYKNIKEVIKYATINSKISHNHPEAVKASIATALCSHYLYYNLGEPKNIIKFILEHTSQINPESNDYFIKIDKLNKLDYKILLGKSADYGVPCDARKTLGVSVYFTKTYFNNPTEALKQSILIGGDVDSSAAVVLGLTLMNNNLEDIPSVLFDNLENKSFGKDYLIKLGSELSRKFKTDESNEWNLR